MRGQRVALRARSTMERTRGDRSIPIALHNTADDRAALIPAAILPFFDDRCVRSFELIEEYVARLTLQVFRDTGLQAVCAREATVDEVIAGAGLKPEVARVPSAWILSMLAARGWVESSRGSNGVVRYRARSTLPPLDPREIEQAQQALDPRGLPSYSVAALAARHYPAVLRGETTGEEALFAPDGLAAWAQYFSNANPLYAISNSIGAVAAADALPAGGGDVLEIGGGLGSGAEALLERLERVGRGADVTAYHFTELVPQFLRRSKKALLERFPQYALSFAWVDIDQPFAPAGLAPGRFALVYGVNVLHVARDLAATLAEIRAVLDDQGVLVIAECARPAPGVPIYVEFVFNLLATFRDPLLVAQWRPNGGFLTPEQWTGALQANGFKDIKIIPDGRRIREAFPSFVVAAIVARKA
jgi:SAM-dependent methyltransferase